MFVIIAMAIFEVTIVLFTTRDVILEITLIAVELVDMLKFQR